MSDMIMFGQSYDMSILFTGCHLQMTWQANDFETFSAMLPTSLRVLEHWSGGVVSLPQLGHLTALTELQFDNTLILGPLPQLPALRLLVADAHHLCNGSHSDAGPCDLGLAAATPLLAEARFNLGKMIAPHEQLGTLMSLSRLKTLVLDFCDYEYQPAENLLRPDTLLSLPPSVTQLVLREFSLCEPDIMLPENVTIVK